MAFPNGEPSNLPEWIDALVSEWGYDKVAEALNDKAADIDEDNRPLLDEVGNCAHEWSYTGSAYGGDDDRWHGEGRCYCSKCGADGDA